MTTEAATFTDKIIATKPNGKDLVRELPCANIPMEDVDEVFHPVSVSQNISAAESLCGRCPVKSDCTMWAWENKESGIWGGVLFHKGKPRKSSETVQRRGVRAR